MLLGLGVARHDLPVCRVRNAHRVVLGRRNLRHANAAITLNVYGHLWPDRDETGRTAVGAVFRERLADQSRTEATISL